MWLPKWVIRRRERDEDAVHAQLYYLAPQPAMAIAEAAGISVVRLYAALDRMEDDGRILSRWSEDGYRRRRMYYLPPRRDIDEGWERS